MGFSDDVQNPRALYNWADSACRLRGHVLSGLTMATADAATQSRAPHTYFLTKGRTWRCPHMRANYLCPGPAAGRGPALSPWLFAAPTEFPVSLLKARSRDQQRLHAGSRLGMQNLGPTSDCGIRTCTLIPEDRCCRLPFPLPRALYIFIHKSLLNTEPKRSPPADQSQEEMFRIF